MIIRNRNVFLGIVVLLVFGVATYVYQKPVSGPKSTPTPSVAVTPITDNTIQIDSPLPGATISSPLIVRGRARGNWFFEASFPVQLTDWDGRIIASVPAQAKGDWMTTEFVSFEATLTFEKPAGPGPDQPNRGFLILRKDNPSGLPQYDDHREMMILFK